MDLIRILEIDQLGEFLRGHVTRVSYAMATSLVVVVSGPVNALLSRIVARWNFLVRTVFYVLLFAVGYPSLAFWTERILRQFLSDQKPVPLVVLTAIAFVGFGVWVGQRKPFR
jgi:hypothetical protein